VTTQRYRFTNRVPTLREYLLVHQSANGDYAALVELVTLRLLVPEQVHEILDLPFSALSEVLGGLVAAFEEGNKVGSLAALFERVGESSDEGA
jgi:hypothetical protein